MQILRRGKKKEDANYVCDCKDCGSRFRFHHDEARFETDRDGHVCVVVCPVCKVENWIDSTVLQRSHVRVIRI